MRLFSGRENGREKEGKRRQGDEAKQILQRNGHFHVITMMEKCPGMKIQRK